MENPQPLSSTESFSYSWLVDGKPYNPPEKSYEKEHNFDFNLPSPNPLVHADEIFLDGHIMPVYTNTSRLNTLRKTSTFSVPPSPISTFVSGGKRYHVFPGKWRRTTKRILQKCFGFMNRPLVGFSRKSNRVDDLERKVCEVENLGVYSVEASPIRTCNGKGDFGYGLRKARSWNSTPQAAASPLTLTSPYRYSNSFCEVDQSSIHEAIMYCKRSIEK